MSSSLEKAIEKARHRKDRHEGLAPLATPQPVPAGEIFRPFSLFSPALATLERNRLLPGISDKAAVNSYKVLRTRILQRLRSNNWRSFIISGAGAGEGKTLTASNIAMTIAKDPNQSVFLVDLDLQRCGIPSSFGLNVDRGIGDYLLGNAEIEDIVYVPEDMERIAIIPNRAPIEHSSELITSARMATLHNWLQERSDKAIIIYDMPPILACDDVLAFLPAVDALLLVVSEGLTQRSHLMRVVDMIGDANLLGVVLNRSKEHSGSSAYY